MPQKKSWKSSAPILGPDCTGLDDHTWIGWIRGLRTHFILPPDSDHTKITGKIEDEIELLAQFEVQGFKCKEDRVLCRIRGEYYWGPFYDDTGRQYREYPFIKIGEHVQFNEIWEKICDSEKGCVRSDFEEDMARKADKLSSTIFIRA
ncbi:hypothetical protein MMC10_006208 [Thelotrema lepadinum]|nr:hypothetical protein [Thelotrema lepadinum]